jgi:hypothetical protein
MSKKALATVLLITLAFAFAPTAGASSAPDFLAPEGGLPAGVEQAGEPVLAAATGGVRWGCVGAVLGFSFGAMAAGAVFGPAALAVAGAYAPVLLPLCS